MQYKVLALDLDGTLTNTEKVITPRTKAALQEAARRGVCIVLASGRPTVGIEPLARELELEKYGGCILSYNGGKIIDCRTGQTLVQHAFPADLIEPVCMFSRYWNVVPSSRPALTTAARSAVVPTLTCASTVSAVSASVSWLTRARSPASRRLPGKPLIASV